MTTEVVPRRLLVVATTEADPDALQGLARERGGEDAEVLVVAPAARISKLDWLTNDEEDARREAAAAARSAAEAVPSSDVVAAVGDSDPLTAIEDALRTFPADEILVVTKPDDEAAWLEQGTGEAARELFSLPVTHVTA